MFETNEIPIFRELTLLIVSIYSAAGTASSENNHIVLH